MVKAGFWFRLAATLLDVALFIPLYWGVVYVITKFYGGKGARMWDLNLVRMSATAGNALWLAYASFEWLVGATPGKMLLGMKIDSATGQPIQRSTLFLRFVTKNSVRIFGLLDAITLTWAIRMMIGKSGAAVFYHEPMNFTLARYIGEICALVLAGGFLLTLRPDRRAMHDLLCGTAVYRKTLTLARSGFQPVTAPVPVEPIQVITPMQGEPT